MDEKYLNDYYSNYDEEGRLLSRHGSIEFLTTARYIDKYLMKGMKILEVGAGTGRYSLHYAKGFHVEAVELIEYNIHCFRNNITADMDVEIQQGNACNLSMHGDNEFDMTLVLGPLYHMYTVEDKKKAILEAIRVTKPGGMLYISFIMNDAVILNWGLVSGNLAKGIKEGIVTDDFHCISSPEKLFEMTTMKDINNLLDDFPITKLHLLATDGMANHFGDCIDKSEDELFNAWLQYHFHTCEREDLIGFSNHVLYVGKKI